MTASVRYGALAALVAAAGLLAWRIAAPPGAPEGTDATDYTVAAREEVAGLGAVGQVLVPALARGDAGLERVARAIADAEGFTVAFYFSTRAAVDAHRLADRDAAALDALRAGFLGRLTRGEFTPGAAIYP